MTYWLVVYIEKGQLRNMCFYSGDNSRDCKDAQAFAEKHTPCLKILTVRMEPVE
jgi:hypothetical protein